MKDKILKKLNKIKNYCKDKFLAIYDNDPSVARGKQKRLGLVVVTVVISVLCILFLVAERSKQKKVEAEEKVLKESKFEFNTLSRGVKNEDIFVKTTKDKVDLLENKLDQVTRENKNLQDMIKESNTKEEVEKLMADQKATIEADLRKSIVKELAGKNNSSNDIEGVVQDERRGIASDNNFKKKVKRKFGQYIPSGSYVKGRLISGVDASVGISAEADPREVTIRITSEVVSAGVGENYLKSKVLRGCTMQCKASGDLSSEKAYLSPVNLTCAKDRNTVIEIPVKGYVVSDSKVGIRGQVVSKEGDLVLKSFLSGAISGIGSSVQNSYGGKFTLGSGQIIGEKQDIKDIFKGGLASGLGSSSEQLSSYFIKRAEMYNPVISIDAGTEVQIFFKEGFSLKEDEGNAN